MALVHDFVVLNKEEYTYNDYMNVLKKVPYDVSINDDLILYYMDYLKWISTYNPSLKVRHTGLNYCGVTVIDIEGATQAYNLFLSIADILKLSPAILKLEGSYSYQLADDDDPLGDSNVERIVRDSLKQEKLIYQRDKIVEQFEKLANCFKKVMDSNGELYVLHMGI